MKRITAAGIFLLANIVGPAMADCTNFGGAMTQAQVTALLNPGNNVYTCYNPGSGRQNNETLLAGNQFQDFKHGAPGPTNRDPTAVVGTYTLGSSDPGTVQYIYTVGGTYTYNICVTPSGNIYQFVNTGTGANLSIAVTSGPGNC